VAGGWEFSATLAAHTAFWLYGAAGGGLLALLATSVWRRRVHRGLAAAALRAQAGGNEPLRPGPAVLYGRVDERDDGAVQIEIEQAGRGYTVEDSSYVVWRQIGPRRQQVLPFYLVRPSGERVRVEPGGNVSLGDQLDGTTRTERKRRVRTARLSAGEAVYASGILVPAPDPRAGGYRDSGLGLVLRAPAVGPMHISTEPPDEHRKRARRHTVWIFVLAALSLLCQAGYLDFTLLRLFGKVVEARVTNTPYKEWTDDDDRTHRTDYVDAVWQGHALHDEQPDYVSIQIGDTVPFVVLEGDPSIHHIGTRPWADGGPIVFFLFVVPIACIYAATLRPPWYRRKRLIERSDGTLADGWPEPEGPTQR
jgi:hypothetical protein